MSRSPSCLFRSVALFGVCMGIIAASARAQTAHVESEREQRRLELRQQWQAERGRWRDEAREGSAPRQLQREDGRLPPRLSEEERRTLRRELRQTAP